MRCKLAAPAAGHSARTSIRTRCLLAVLLATNLAIAAVPAISAESGPGWTGSDRIAIVQPPKPIADFELADQDGKPFRFSQLRNRPVLVYFGFTHCPDVCPATLAKLRALNATADQKIRDVAVVMISVDGDRDNPATMKTYLAQMSPQFIGLTGDPRAVRGIAAQFPAVFFKGLPDRQGGEYLVEHTSQVYLIDRHGRLCAVFSDAPIGAMRQALHTLADEPAGENASSR